MATSWWQGHQVGIGDIVIAMVDGENWATLFEQWTMELRPANPSYNRFSCPWNMLQVQGVVVFATHILIEALH